MDSSASISEILQHSSDLVKKWGQTRLSNGKNLSEMLTIRGLSLWDVVAVDLALYRVPEALTCIGIAKCTPLQQIRPYLSWTKQSFLDFIIKQRNSSGDMELPPGLVFLFLGFSKYFYRDVLQPVVEYMARSKEIRTISLHNERHWWAAAPQDGWDGAQSIWQYWNAEVEAQAHGMRKELQTALAELKEMRALPQIIEDQDRSLWSQMQDIFIRFFRAYLPRLLSEVAIARHILEKYRPALVISPDVADPRTRIYCLLCLQIGIPSLEIQFGMYGKDSVEWQFFVADRVAVWGEKPRTVLISHGIPDRKITVTGSPRHDSLFKASMVDREMTSARPCGEQAKVVVLFASSYSVGAYDEISDAGSKPLTSIKKAVFQASKQTTGLSILVKPHPLENVKSTKQLASGCRNVVFADQQADIRELIKRCDVFITLGTTATLDALILNKLVIWPAFPGFVWWDDLFLQSGVTIVVRNPKELAHNLQSLVDGSRKKMLLDLEKARQKFLQQWVYKTDGHASARIESLSFEMAKLDKQSKQTV